jgi:uncharacterized protein (TIGR02453 family)
MVSMERFNGFTKQTIQFFKDLQNNNNRTWFKQNRHIYDNLILPQAETFVVEIGQKLQKFAPNITAIPKVDKSIFRIYRDTRFSKDKKPYKTHLACLFWEGSRIKMENSAFYFQLSSEKIFIGVGMHTIPRSLLNVYRDSVVDPEYGPDLIKAISSTKKNKNYILGWKKFKTIPKDYNSDHPHAEYLLYGGMGFHFETTLPKEVYSSEMITYCYQIFKDMSPIHIWIKKMSERE